MSGKSETIQYIKIGAKVIQGIFFGVFLFGVFLLGVALAAGDVSVLVELPVSAISVTTAVYGLLGMLACEFVARRVGGET